MFVFWDKLTGLASYASREKTKYDQDGDAMSLIERLDKDPVAIEKGNICMVGDSDFTYWMNMQRDMAPHKVYNAGFGGSITSGILDNCVEIVIKHAPSVIVFNCGNNDVLFGVS
jgi:hypothetical protein